MTREMVEIQVSFFTNLTQTSEDLLEDLNVFT